ncbi:hypothetical protein [Francisella tularensis]|uniref:hypothetical protein n=1 Tax=Francisella tularensis TaxID=263 RepID=UPI001C0EE7AA|nr:hypothetical protein [Francisella tularensis]MBK2143431.1 hypothetical protein [Francisella tularensis]
MKHYFDGVVAGETIFEAKYGVSGTSNFVADNYIKNLANIRGDRGIYKPSENEVVIYSYNCLLYTSDAADDKAHVYLVGCRFFINKDIKSFDSIVILFTQDIISYSDLLSLCSSLFS